MMPRSSGGHFHPNPDPDPMPEPIRWVFRPDSGSPRLSTGRHRWLGFDNRSGRQVASIVTGSIFGDRLFDATLRKPLGGTVELSGFASLAEAKEGVARTFVHRYWPRRTVVQFFNRRERAKHPEARS